MERFGSLETQYGACHGPFFVVLRPFAQPWTRVLAPGCPLAHTVGRHGLECRGAWSGWLVKTDQGTSEFFFRRDSDEDKIIENGVILAKFRCWSPSYEDL